MWRECRGPWRGTKTSIEGLHRGCGGEEGYGECAEGKRGIQRDAWRDMEFWRLQRSMEEVQRAYRGAEGQ